MEYVRQAHAFTCHPKPWWASIKDILNLSTRVPPHRLYRHADPQILSVVVSWLDQLHLVSSAFYLFGWLVSSLLYFLSIAEFKPTVNKYKYLTCFCFVLDSSFVLYVLTISGTVSMSMSINTHL